MEKINIAELLKDCPKGMELDCTMYENVYFDKIYNEEDCLYPIGCYIIGNNNRNSVNFTKYGEFNYHSNAKCIIFPKGKITWEGFVPPCKFKDGDIVSTENGTWIGITTGGKCGEFIPTYCVINSDDELNIYFDEKEEWAFNRLATEEEKAKLFQAIKNNGYYWNDKTKTLEKLVEPKFKVGDEIVKRNSISNSWIVSSVSSEYYGLKLLKGIGVLPVSEQDDWELLSNIKPKFKVGDVIQDKDGYKVKITEVNLEDECYGYESIIVKGIGGIVFSEQNNWKLVPNKFDITTLVPFESKVLVRDKNNDKWIGQFFSHYDNGSDRPYVCIGIEGLCEYKKCIPFKNNEYLLGKTDDCDEYYKNW